MRKKKIKFGKIKIKMLDTPRTMMIQIDFGRYKRGKEIDTWPIYDATAKKHKPFLDEVLLDVQDKKAIGLDIVVDKMSKKEFKKMPGITNL